MQIINHRLQRPACTNPDFNPGVNYTAVVFKNTLDITITVPLDPTHVLWYNTLAVTATGFVNLANTTTAVTSTVCGCTDSGVIVNTWPVYPSPPPPQILSFTAFRATALGDYILNAGDGVEIEFDIPTNLGMQGVTYTHAANLSWVQPFINGTNVTASFGAAFTGLWVTWSKLRITFTDTTGLTALPGVSAVRILASGDLRDYSGRSSASTAQSGLLTGSFVDFSVLDFWAIDTQDGSDYVSGDQVAIMFVLPTSITAGTVWTQAQIDAAFTFSQVLGASYSGTWATAATFYITITNVTGFTARIGELVISSVKIQDLAGLSYGAVPVSAPIRGGWSTRKYLQILFVCKRLAYGIMS